MAEPLKNAYGPEIPRTIATMIVRVHPSFRREVFLADALDGYEELELLARGRHIARVLRRHLPEDYERAIEILLASAGPVRRGADRQGIAPFLYLPHTYFVEAYGLEHFEASMHAQYELTKRFTAEFSIRAFLEREPRRTLARLRAWASDPDEHVRRLVSEGTRPRLPWAKRLPAFQRDPKPVLALLELLKDDPSLYVRRSVANNLNDIGKDHPELVVRTCRAWTRGATPERRWLIRHALRSSVKRGEPGALRLLGFGASDAVVVSGKALPRRVKMGSAARLSIEIANRSSRPQRVLVDFRVHFVKARGATSAKVFKGKAVTLAPKGRATIDKRISFQSLTTRKPYPGRHRVEALLSGRAVPVGAFEVTP
jgi:3-methyladenine DNA glycosylase AlkC